MSSRAYYESDTYIKFNIMCAVDKNLSPFESKQYNTLYPISCTLLFWNLIKRPSFTNICTMWDDV